MSEKWFEADTPNERTVRLIAIGLSGRPNVEPSSDELQVARELYLDCAAWCRAAERLRAQDDDAPGVDREADRLNCKGIALDERLAPYGLCLRYVGGGKYLFMEL